MPNIMTPQGERNDISEGDQELTPEQSEAQMRRALETLSANAPARGPSGPAQLFGRPQNKKPNGYGPGQSNSYAAATARKHRFVQDGEVPVVHLPLQKDRPGPAAAADQRLNRENAARDTTARETSDRMQHERSDRALLDAQSAIRGLQTKLAHAEIAASEAVQRANVQADAANAVRAELQQLRGELRAAEQARQTLENRLADQRATLEAEIDRLRAELDAARMAPPPAAPVPISTDPEPMEPEQKRPRLREVQPALPLTETPSPKPRGRPGRKPREKPVDVVPEIEPEPVKWWLTTKPKPVRAARGSKKG